MKNESKKNTEIITKALNDFFNQTVETHSISLPKFISSMEKVFTETGYRGETPGKQTNILILHDAGVGDFIMMTGAIREIRRLYPTAHITLAIFPTSMSLAEFCPYVDEVVIKPRAERWFQFQSYFPHNIKILPPYLEKKFDICFNFARWSESYFFAYMCGARVRISYDYPDKEKDFMPLEGDVPITIAANLSTMLVPRYRFGKHMADISFSLVDNLLQAPVTNRELEIWYSPLDITLAKNILKDVKGKVYALCMGGAAPRKMYPPEMYAKVVEMILDAEPDTTFVILGGGKPDLDAVEVFKKNLPEKYHKNFLNVVGKANYRQSGAILKFCDMYIGNDTGPIHMAAIAKCPVLEPNCFSADIPFHETDSPKLWYPYKVPVVIIQPKHALPECFSTDKTHNHYGCKSPKSHCITQIKPETVFKGFKLLKKRIAENNIEPMFMS